MNEMTIHTKAIINSAEVYNLAGQKFGTQTIL